MRKIMPGLFLILSLGLTQSAHAQNGTQHNTVSTWTAPSPVGGSGTIMGYNLYRCSGTCTLTTGTFARQNSAVLPATPDSFTDNNVTPNTTYTYAATTVDSNGNESVFSNLFTVFVPQNPNAPTGLTIVAHSGEFKKK